MAPVVKGELSESEQKLMDAVLKGTIQEITSLLNQPDVRVDCLDKSGMTPLQHACFKGRPEVVRCLLENGADVNANFHENSYSTLHFAALSGNVEVTGLVLEAGAKTDLTNSVNRTATQMAAFVGQHQCVRAINNFFPRQELEKYTVPTGFETEPKLPPALLSPLLQLVNMTNLNPVKIGMYLKDHMDLVLESYKVCKVLDVIVEGNMKSRETNDIQAIKCHYYASIIRLANKQLKNSQDTLDAFIKSLVKGREQDGFPEIQDRVIRQALRDFPYPESQLLQTLVQQIAPVEIGEGTSALGVLTSGMYGPSFEDETACTTCGDSRAAKTCTACKCTKYCSQTCQKLHWSTHKKFCKKLGEQFQRMEVERLKAEEKAEKDKKEKEEMEAKMQEAKLEDPEAGGSGDGEGDDMGKEGGQGDGLENSIPADTTDSSSREAMCDAGENGHQQS